MVSVKEMLEVLYETVEGICGRVYLQERPSSTDEKAESFIVVELPSTISDMEIGQDGEYGYYNTTAQMTIFVRDKRSARNPGSLWINRLDGIAQSVMSKFPVKDEKRSVLLKRPRIMVPANTDEHGFHYMILQSDLTTLI